MIGKIETGILARLQYASEMGALPYRWALAETYPEDWDTYFKNKAVIRTPAVWATFGGFDRVQGTNAGSLATASFGVIVAAQNLRSEEATRHGRVLPAGKIEVGSYQLMLDAAGVLAGDDLDLDMEGLTLVETAHVASAHQALRNTSMWALRFTTKLTIPSIEIEEGAVDFRTFHANWDIPPHGNVDGDPAKPGVQLPADATADATDHLELKP